MSALNAARARKPLVSAFMLVDLSALPKDCPKLKLESAEIINFEIARKTYRIEKFLEALQRDPESALGWFNCGRAFLDAKEHYIAVEYFTQAIEINPKYPQFYNNRGVASFFLDHCVEALLDFDEAIKLLEGLFNALRDIGETISLVQEPLVSVLLNKGLTLRNLNRHQDELDTYDRVLDLFHGAEEPSAKPIALALFLKGVALSVLGRTDEEMAVYQELTDQFGSASEPEVRANVAWALFNKGTTLTVLNRHDQALAAYEDLIERFGHMTDPALREPVAGALCQKGLTLSVLRRYSQAILAYDDLVKRFNDASEPELRDYVKDALLNKGVALKTSARHELSVGHFNQANSLFRHAIRCDPDLKQDIKNSFENYFLQLYNLDNEEENPSNGYDLPKRVIAEAELRAYIKEQASLLTGRIEQPDGTPFPILSERTVKAIIAHGKKHPWDDRRAQGWPYHTNAFVYVHITYRKWVNRGLTREILAKADEPLYAHLNRKVSLEGLPGWLDLPSGPEARARALKDPAERAELEIVRKHQRRRWRDYAQRKGQGD